MNVQAYLDRIGYRGPTTPDEAVLRNLHRAHMFTVPFENLDIGLGRQILCNNERFLQKIVRERRGGFCYELNGAFAALLQALGFQVSLLSARVFRTDGSRGPDFDHMALLADLEDRWLADVGFGDSFVEPLRLETGIEQEQFGRRYRITGAAERYHYEADSNGTWKPAYSFTLLSRRLSEFDEMCRYHQTSPDSHFTRNPICSLATPQGRITLSGDRLIETRDGARKERLVSEAERREILLEKFGVKLPG